MMSVLLAQLIDTYRSSKAAYPFFDSNVWLPLSAHDSLHPIDSLPGIADELKRHSIQHAVVTYARSLEYDPRLGNEDVMSGISGLSGLYGAIIWSPEIAISRKAAADYLDMAIERKTAIVRLFPKKLRYSLNKWQLGDLLAAMEARKLPLSIWHTEAGWDQIQQLCSAYPQLPIIVEGNDQKLLYHNRSFIPLMEQHDNLYLETHNLVQHAIFEYCVNERGIDRFVFGSYLPHQDPDAAMLMVADADIPEAAKTNIAGNHFRRLLGDIVA